MSIKCYSIFFSLLAIATRTFCQTSVYEYFISVNGNLYVPINNPAKGMYPIIGYDKGTDAKLLVGGLGVGMSAFKPIKSKVSLKGQANLSKHTYWDEPVELKDANGSPVGSFLAGSSDYALGVTAMAHYFLTEKISVGTGIGAQILLISLSRLPPVNNSKKSIAVNRYYKPFVPTLPVELSLKSRKKLYTFRYEHGLLNRFKSDLKNYKTDRFGLLTFEIGFTIRK